MTVLAEVGVKNGYAPENEGLEPKHHPTWNPDYHLKKKTSMTLGSMYQEKALLRKKVPFKKRDGESCWWPKGWTGDPQPIESPGFQVFFCFIYPASSSSPLYLEPCHPCMVYLDLDWLSKLMTPTQTSRMWKNHNPIPSMGLVYVPIYMNGWFLG